MRTTWRVTHLEDIERTVGDVVDLNVDKVILVDVIFTVTGGKEVVDTDDDVETGLDVDTLETKRRIV